MGISVMVTMPKPGSSHKTVAQKGGLRRQREAETLDEVMYVGIRDSV